jgi:stage III sporulation protein SpoIIIAA
LVTVEQLAQDELQQLLAVLPERITHKLREQEELDDLLEVILDLGRLPEARFSHGDVMLGEEPVNRADLQYVVSGIGNFGDDNRAGMERTLHRISAIRNRSGNVVGITCRVGRAVFGTIKIIEDLAYSGQNILLLGRPGVGKTTMLREVARVLADEARKRVIIVDTSNEIAGDGDIPHPAIGHSRRMQVPTPTEQHGVMIEAVENHMPETVVIDEMGAEQEAAAARTIAERGVQLIATAHGNTLDNLIMNPTLSDLVGGIQTVTLGDQEARYRGTQKTVLERKAPPTFDVVVEIQSWERLAVHDDVAHVVDQWLRGYPIVPEVRWLDENGEVQRAEEEYRANADAPPPFAMNGTKRQQEDRRSGRDYGHERRGDFARAPGRSVSPPRPMGEMSDEEEAMVSEVRVFLFGVGRDKLEAAMVESGTPAQIVNELRRADLVLTTKTHYRRGSQLVRIAEANGKPVYVLRKNSLPQLQDFLRTVVAQRNPNGQFRGGRAPAAEPQEAPNIERAMHEAEEAANRVLSGEEMTVKLSPQRSHIRRLQHMLGQRYNVASTSQGREPDRAVMFYRV